MMKRSQRVQLKRQSLKNNEEIVNEMNMITQISKKIFSFFFKKEEKNTSRIAKSLTTEATSKRNNKNPSHKAALRETRSTYSCKV